MYEIHLNVQLHLERTEKAQFDLKLYFSVHMVLYMIYFYVEISKFFVDLCIFEIFLVRKIASRNFRKLHSSRVEFIFFAKFNFKIFHETRTHRTLQTSATKFRSDGDHDDHDNYI